MMTFTLRNDFHNSTARVRCDFQEEQDFIVIRPNATQMKRATRELCGVAGCTCGGLRGLQHTANGTRLIVDY